MSWEITLKFTIPRGSDVMCPFRWVFDVIVHYVRVFCLADADLEIDENAMMSRHEEDRITQAEKNKRMQEQLQVKHHPFPCHPPPRHPLPLHLPNTLPTFKFRTQQLDVRKRVTMLEVHLSCYPTKLEEQAVWLWPYRSHIVSLCEHRHVSSQSRWLAFMLDPAENFIMVVSIFGD